MKRIKARSNARISSDLPAPELNMRRVKFWLQPGMLNCICTRDPKQSPHAVIRNLVCGQLAKLSGWDGRDVLKSWPPINQPPDKRKQSANVSATPTDPRDLAITEVITDLWDRCDDFNTPLSGIENLDADLKRQANEVASIYLPAVERYFWHIIRCLASLAGPNSENFSSNFLFPRFLIGDVAKDFGDLAVENFPKAVIFLKEIGLIVPTTTIPSAMPWKPRPNLPTQPPVNNPQKKSAVVRRKDVPFPDSVHAKVKTLEGTLHLGKEKICFALLVSALADISPEVHLRRTAEAANMRRHLNVLSCIYSRVIQRYEGCLDESIEVPDHDKTLRPFLEQSASQLKKLEEDRKRVELLLVSAEAVRTGGDDFGVLIQLANEARRLAGLEGEAVNFKRCQELAALLTSLGIEPIIWPS